jgi:hypothetical protein
MRPIADPRLVELAERQFPYREMSVREYAATYAQATAHGQFQAFVGFRYPDEAMETWVDEFARLLGSPAELAACREEFLGTTAVEYRLFCLGGCIDRSHVVRIPVASGQFVEVNQLLMEVETEKTMMEFRCPQAGRVNLLVKEGQQIHEGDLLIRIEPSDHWPVPSPVWHDWWNYSCGSVASESWHRRSKLLAEAEARRPRNFPSGGR